MKSAVARALVQIALEGMSRPVAFSLAERSLGVYMELLVRTKNLSPSAFHWFRTSSAPGSAFPSCTSTPSMSVNQHSIFLLSAMVLLYL